MSWIKKLFSTGAKDIIDSGKNLIDELITNKEEREQLKAQFQALQNQHAEKMAELAQKEYEVEVEDRKSARQREAEFLKATGHMDYLQWFLAVAAMGIFGYLIWSVINDHVEEKNRELVFHIFGIVEGVLLSIFTYYFGSSAGSRIKDMRK